MKSLILAAMLVALAPNAGAQYPTAPSPTILPPSAPLQWGSARQPRQVAPPARGTERARPQLSATVTTRPDGRGGLIHQHSDGTTCYTRPDGRGGSTTTCN